MLRWILIALSKFMYRSHSQIFVEKRKGYKSLSISLCSYLAVSWQFFFTTLASTSRLASNLRSYSCIGWGVCSEGGRRLSWRTCHFSAVATYSNTNEGSSNWSMLYHFWLLGLYLFTYISNKLELWCRRGLSASGELLAQPWTCSYRIKAGECAHKPCR